MRRISPARLPETLAFLMRRRALGRLGGLGALALSHNIHAESFPKRLPRIVCVGGALTEIMFALGAQSCLVGVDSTSIFPLDAQQLPQVGYARTLSAEGILALAPTHLLVTEEAGPLSVMRQVSSVGVSVQLMDSGYRFEGLIDRIARVGRLVGREVEAQALIVRLQHEWTHLHPSLAVNPSSMPVVTPPRVLFLFSHRANRLMAAGVDTGAHAMIEYAGAINATPGFSGYKPLTPESLVAAQPDVVLLTDHGLQVVGDRSAISKLPGMSQTPAGRDQRFAVMDAGLLLGFGPRLPAAVNILKSHLT
jgi:iron complex transport system substrate-binding protein